MEIWKDIEGYENHYQVSNYGRVKALYRHFINAAGHIKKYPERILKVDVSTTNIPYCRVTLSKNHVTKRFSVHRLVAQAFIPNLASKPHVNHLNNDGLDNRVENLEWVTHSENMLHAQKQNRLFAAQSKGGHIGGKVTRQRMLDTVAKLIETTIGGYKILGLGEPNKHGRVTLKTMCIYCNSEYIRTKDYMLNAPQNGCFKCKHKVKI
jgi:hypothetical protein